MHRTNLRKITTKKNLGQACKTQRFKIKNTTGLFGNFTNKMYQIPVVLQMVGEGGFEPPKSVTTDLQSAPFGRSGIPPYCTCTKRQGILYHVPSGLSRDFAPFSADFVCAPPGFRTGYAHSLTEYPSSCRYCSRRPRSRRATVWARFKKTRAAASPSAPKPPKAPCTSR